MYTSKLARLVQDDQEKQLVIEVETKLFGVSTPSNIFSKFNPCRSFGLIEDRRLAHVVTVT